MKGYLYKITPGGKMYLSKQLSDDELVDIMCSNPSQNIITKRNSATCIAPNRRIAEKLADTAYWMCTF